MTQKVAIFTLLFGAIFGHKLMAANPFSCKILLGELEPGVTYATWKEARQSQTDLYRSDTSDPMGEEELHGVVDEFLVSTVLPNLLENGRQRIAKKAEHFFAGTPYDGVIITTRLPERTYHKIAHDFGMVLTLPQDRSDTLWANLTPYGRRELIVGIARALRKGKYSLPKEFEVDYQSISYAEAAKEAEQYDYDKPSAVGISPQLLVAQADAKKEAGVCRHGACAMAGLLGELGVSNSNLRLVSGGLPAEPESRHIWVEIKLEDGPDAKWVEMDPTPRSLSGTNARLGVMFDLLDPDGPNSNRRKYSNRLRLVENLLSPTEDFEPKRRVPAPPKANP